jgi:MoxR-like ATPase
MNGKQSEECLVDVSEAYKRVIEATNGLIVGNKSLIELIFMSVLAGGHILVEGLPGTAKTTVCKLMARLMGFDFKRVQGAVDVQPMDVTGIRVFDPEKKEFIFHQGPIFTNFLLVDEINRLTPKTQAAFIEAMSEHQTTIDGITFSLSNPYFVIATQNSSEMSGTFPLIEAHRDRFTYSCKLHYLGSDDEFELIRRDHAGGLDWYMQLKSIDPLVHPEWIRQAVQAIRQTYVHEAAMQYIRDLVVATRSHSDVRLGASSRASLALLRGSKASAALQGRSFVTPEDVKHVAPSVFRHRILLSREAEIARIGVEQVIDEILDTVEVS